MKNIEVFIQHLHFGAGIKAPVSHDIWPLLKRGGIIVKFL